MLLLPLLPAAPLFRIPGDMLELGVVTQYDVAPDGGSFLTADDHPHQLAIDAEAAMTRSDARPCKSNTAGRDSGGTMVSSA